MDKIILLQKIKEHYLQGGNIIQYLRSIDKRDYNTIEDILISYDFQAGSYIREYYKNPDFKNKYCMSLANVINGLGEFSSIIEAGIGEATTLRNLLVYLKNEPGKISGFDISWSRLIFAQEFLKELSIKKVQLFTANLFEIPLPDHSFDIVYTSHTIEPNGGREEAALKELYRIAGQYLILLEPAYDLANDEAKSRMRQHGYITNLIPAIEKLKYKIIEHRLFDFSSNPLNPTGLTVIRKEGGRKGSIKNQFICPVSHTKLRKYKNSAYYSSESMLAYPVLKGIPCLLKEHAIIATHFMTDYKEFKETIENRK